MTVFRITMRSLDDGKFAANWFDDERRLWDDDRLHKGAPLATDWVRPRLQSFRRAGTTTDVMFNPNAIAVSGPLREALRRFAGVELLPVDIEGEGAGAFSLVHVTALADLTRGMQARRAPPPSGNVVDLQAFPANYEAPAPLFRVRQPPDSAAGAKGYCLAPIYANEEGARVIEMHGGAYLVLERLKLACR